jgi:hypothetical protein
MAGARLDNDDGALARRWWRGLGSSAMRRARPRAWSAKGLAATVDQSEASTDETSSFFSIRAWSFPAVRYQLAVSKPTTAECRIPHNLPPLHPTKPSVILFHRGHRNGILSLLDRRSNRYAMTNRGSFLAQVG